jgi:hypothetical protein
MLNQLPNWVYLCIPRFVLSDDVKLPQNSYWDGLWHGVYHMIRRISAIVAMQTNSGKAGLPGKRLFSLLASNPLARHCRLDGGATRALCLCEMMRDVLTKFSTSHQKLF